MKPIGTIASAFFVLAAFCVSNACAQRPQSMGEMLDAVDQPQSWAQTPVRAAAPVQNAPQYNSGQFNNGYNEFNNAQPANGWGANTLRQPQMTGSNQNPFSMQNIFKTLMGGGGNSGSNNSGQPKNDSEARATAQENLQTARDQQAQANDDANAIGGISDRGEKQSRAESARYHAQAAREAADRAYEAASSSGSSAANDIASAARAAADSAQAAADRATARASGGGW
jgi:hypothetical protein